METTEAGNKQEKKSPLKIAISTEQRSAAVQLQQSLRKLLPCADIRLISNISSIKSLQNNSKLICVLPAIDRAGALLDETLARNPWLISADTSIIALLNIDDPSVIERLCDSGVSDCWHTDSESLSGLAEWLSYQGRALNRVGDSASVEVSEKAESFAQARNEAFCQTVATVNHQINNPLSSILATIELALDGDAQLNPSEIKRLKEIQNHARRIANVTARLREIICPDVFQTPAGTMLEFDNSASERNSSEIVALARSRYSLSSLPSSLPILQDK